MKTENRKSIGSVFIQPAGAPASPEASRDRPAWIRLPRPGEPCQWTGLSRSTLWTIVKAGNVRTATMKITGKKRGVRLLSLESLLGYLESVTEEDTPGGDSQADEK